jgi:chromosome segregation ATPase
MTLEESLKALKSAFTNKRGEAEAMAKEMSELKSKNDTLAAEYAAVAEKLEASAAVIADRDSAIAKVEELTKALAASESLKAEAAKQIESVGKVAAKIVASVGVSPVEISAADSAVQKTPEEVWTEYCAMKDPAKKQAFYNANRSAIVSHLGIK